MIRPSRTVRFLQGQLLRPSRNAPVMILQSNFRTDEYSASSENALRLLRRIVASIRDAVPADFVVGIKFNVRNHLSGDQTEAEARVLDHFKSIAVWNSIDFIEVSGGDYENPG